MLLRERVESLSRLMEVTALISSTLDLDEVLSRVMSLAKEMMAAEAASILLWNEEIECLEFQTSVGGVGVEQLKTIRVPRGQGIAGTVVETGEPLLVADVTKDSRFFTKADEATGFVTKSILAAPLIVQDKIIGVGEVLNHTDGRPFTPLDLDLFASFCRQVAVAIENARLHKEEV
ncbi:MAG: GAF domain-containing protein [Nitrospinota bacterium]